MIQPTPSINGQTALIAHIGYPTHTFKSPQIYNPYFAWTGVNAVVVPMACRAASLAPLMHGLFALENLCGALITMPHKVAVVEMLHERSLPVQVAGACNAVRRGPDGQLIGDLFDGEGFVRGLQRKGQVLHGAQALVLGCGGVGSAIAASLALAGVQRLRLFDEQNSRQEALAARLRRHFPSLEVDTGGIDAGGFGLVVNATPLGMNDADPLPLAPERIDPGTFVADVVLRDGLTPWLRAAAERGHPFLLGADMLFEQIPAYLEFFGLPSTTPEVLRQHALLPADSA